ncbi:MAG: helix-turn-helix transcriptional regulator, partial [Clostridia bacterium]|nr:helix-turn-helix transcriptional regulator [Clostridia bacterium]
KNTLCHRWVREPIVMYLFRYKSDTHAFDSEHVIFKDQTRLATTFAMLEQLDCEVFREDFEYRSRLFSDLVMQYSMENRQRHSVDEPIERAIAHINRSLHKGTRLARIGEESGLSYVQFLRRFKAFTGVSPSEYITALRLQKAKQMLTDTDLRVKDIASACGFENEYYFSNFFKKHTSISPSAFRASSP